MQGDEPVVGVERGTDERRRVSTQVVRTEVARSSGRHRLDEHASAIVRQAAPYGAFSPAMRQQAEQIVVVTGFRFARDHSLHTRMLVSPKGTP